MTETAKLTASDAAPGDILAELGISGDSIVAGAQNDDDGGSNSGSAYVFEKPVGGWGSVPSPIHETAKLTASDAQAGDGFGSGAAIDGNTIVVGAHQVNTGPGSAYVFERQAGTWTESAKLVPSDGAGNDRFGFAPAIQGDTIVIGAFFDDDSGNDSGSGYVFQRPAGGWDSVPSPITETGKLLASDGAPGDNFGISAAINLDGTVVVGAYAHRFQSDAPGFAYVFPRPAGGWASTPSPIHESAKLTASDGASGDQFGSRVSISADLILVGSPLDDHAGGTDAGSAYVFAVGGDDCNGNGEFDQCDIADGTSEDCNANGIPDECDIADGTSKDCDGSEIPDECELISEECPYQRGDVSNDGKINEHDVLQFILVLLGLDHCACSVAAADINGDGVVDLWDVRPFMRLLRCNLGHHWGNTDGYEPMTALILLADELGVELDLSVFLEEKAGWLEPTEPRPAKRR